MKGYPYKHFTTEKIVMTKRMQWINKTRPQSRVLKTQKSW